MSLTRLQNARRASSSGLLSAVGRGYAYDADAETFIAAVEAADGQTLEYSWRLAITTFVAGCKADGIWSAMALCYIMCGARTLAGALTPLTGSAPTNNGPFVTGDYTRGGATPGLKGNGSTKFLNTNRIDNADGQNDVHRACYASEVATTQFMHYFGARNAGLTQLTELLAMTNGNAELSRCRVANGVAIVSKSPPVSPGFKGMARSSSASFDWRSMVQSGTRTETSVSGVTNNINVFATGGSTSDRSTARIAFFSAGSALTLTTLEARATALVLAARELA
jgi:hypothetical protein